MHGWAGPLKITVWPSLWNPLLKSHKAEVRHGYHNVIYINTRQSKSKMNGHCPGSLSPLGKYSLLDRRLVAAILKAVGYQVSADL